MASRKLVSDMIKKILVLDEITITFLLFEILL